MEPGLSFREKLGELFLMHREHGEVPEESRSYCDPVNTTRSKSKSTPKKSPFGEGKWYSDMDSDYGGSGMTSDDGGSGGNKGESESEEGLDVGASASAVKAKASVSSAKLAVRRQKKTMLVAAALTAKALSSNDSDSNSDYVTKIHTSKKAVEKKREEKAVPYMKTEPHLTDPRSHKTEKQQSSVTAPSRAAKSATPSERERASGEQSGQSLRREREGEGEGERGGRGGREREREGERERVREGSSGSSSKSHRELADSNSRAGESSYRKVDSVSGSGSVKREAGGKSMSMSEEGETSSSRERPVISQAQAPVEASSFSHDQSSDDGGVYGVQYSEDDREWTETEQRRLVAERGSKRGKESTSHSLNTPDARVPVTALLDSSDGSSDEGTVTFIGRSQMHVGVGRRSREDTPGEGRRRSEDTPGSSGSHANTAVRRQESSLARTPITHASHVLGVGSDEDRDVVKRLNPRSPAQATSSSRDKVKHGRDATRGGEEHASSGWKRASATSDSMGSDRDTQLSKRKTPISSRPVAAAVAPVSVLCDSSSDEEKIISFEDSEDDEGNERNVNDDDSVSYMKTKSRHADPGSHKIKSTTNKQQVSVTMDSRSAISATSTGKKYVLNEDSNSDSDNEGVGLKCLTGRVSSGKHSTLNDSKSINRSMKNNNSSLSLSAESPSNIPIKRVLLSRNEEFRAEDYPDSSPEPPKQRKSVTAVETAPRGRNQSGSSGSESDDSESASNSDKKRRESEEEIKKQKRLKAFNDLMEFKKSSTVTPAQSELLRLRAEEAEKSDQRERLGNVLGIKEMKIIQSGVVPVEEELTELEKLERDHALKRDEMKKKIAEDLQRVQDAIEEEKRKEKVLLFLERCSRKQQKQKDKEKEDKEKEEKKEREKEGGNARLPSAPKESQESEKGRTEDAHDASDNVGTRMDDDDYQNEDEDDNENGNVKESRGSQRAGHQSSIEVIEVDDDGRVREERQTKGSRGGNISQMSDEYSNSVSKLIIVDNELGDEENDDDDDDDESVRRAEKKIEKARLEFDRWEVDRERELDERKVKDAEQESIAKGAVFQVKMMEQMQNSEQSEINLQRNKDWQAKRQKATPQKGTPIVDKHIDKHVDKRKQSNAAGQAGGAGAGAVARPIRSSQPDFGSKLLNIPAKLNRAERRRIEKDKLDEAMCSGAEDSTNETAGQTAGMMELQRQMTAQRDEMKRKIEGELKRVDEAIATEKENERVRDKQARRAEREKEKERVRVEEEQEEHKRAERAERKKMKARLELERVEEEYERALVEEARKEKQEEEARDAKKAAKLLERSEKKIEKARLEFDRWEVDRERELDERKVKDAEQESIAKGAVFQVKMMEQMQNSEQSEINLQRNKDWQAKRQKATPQKGTPTADKHVDKRRQSVEVGQVGGATGSASKSSQPSSGSKAVHTADHSPAKMNRAERRKSVQNNPDAPASSGVEGSTDETAGQTAGMMELQRQMTAQRDEMKRKIEGELKRVEEAIAAEKRKGQAQPVDAEPDNDWKPDKVKKEKSKDKVKSKEDKESSKKHARKKEKVAKGDRSGDEIVNESGSSSTVDQTPSKMNRAERRKSVQNNPDAPASSGVEGSTDETAGQTAGMMELQRQMTAQRDEMKRKIEGELKRVDEAIAAEKRKEQGQGQQRVKQDEGEQGTAQGKDEATEKERKKERDRIKRKLWKEKSKLKWAKSTDKKSEDGEEGRGKADKKSKVQDSVDEGHGSESEASSKNIKKEKEVKRERDTVDTGDAVVKVKSVKREREESGSSSDEAQAKIARRTAREEKRQQKAKAKELRRELKESKREQSREREGSPHTDKKSDILNDTQENSTEERKIKVEVERPKKDKKSETKKRVKVEPNTATDDAAGEQAAPQSKTELSGRAIKKEKEVKHERDTVHTGDAAVKVKSVKREREEIGSASAEAQAKIARRAAREEKRGGR